MAKIESGSLVAHNSVFIHCSTALEGSNEQALRACSFIFYVWGKKVLTPEQRTILTSVYAK